MTTEKCLLCHKPFFPLPMGERDAYSFQACKECGSVFASPWPAAEELDAFFGEIQPEIVHAPNPRDKVFEARKNISKSTGQYEGLRFLDVCARQGYGVDAAQGLGFKTVHGIDLHPFCIKFLKDKYDPQLFTQSTVQDYAASGEKADFIYITEGYCEQPDPEGYTAALAKILSPDGKIYIQEPDGNHLRLPTNFAAWAFADPPINFCYPSKKGMEALLGRHGLKISKAFFTWSPFMRLVVTHK